MAENQNLEQQNTDVSEYISAIQQLKASTVSKEQYEELQGREKKLLQALVSGEGLGDAAAAPEEKASITDLRRKLFNGEEMSNLEYISTALELRNRLIEEGEKDPFLPWGEKISPTYDDTLAAERVAQVFQECIDYAQGDSTIFTQELQRRTVDVKRR